MSATIFHIPFIAANAPLLTLHSILQRNPQPGSSAPDDHPSVKHHTDLTSFLADPDLDLVIVTTPPDSHFDVTKASLEAGKHVLVEKPFVPTVTQAKDLCDLSRQAGKFLCVFQNRRWDADFLTVKKLVEEGKLGRVVEFESHFDRYRPDVPTTWKSRLGIKNGGGPVFDLGSHLIDQIYVLFGLPTAVFAKFVNQREGTLGGEPDGFTAMLSYDNGLVALVRVGIMSIEKRQPRFWVRGTKGSYRKSGLDSQEDQLKAGMKTEDPGFGLEDEEWDGVLTSVVDGEMKEEKCPNVEPETYKKLLEGFGLAIRKGSREDVPVKGEEAMDVLRIIEAVIESAKTGSEVKMR
jgi:predicted dehydrogenase